MKKAQTARGKFPKHLGPSAAYWRNKKRTEWAAVMAALDDYQYGCAYVPLYAELRELVRKAERIETVFRSRSWVAW